jgi:hypothetical protein
MNINFGDDDDEDDNDNRDDRIVQFRNSQNEQRRRQKVLQLGLMLCFILMLFDGNNRDISKQNNSSNYQNDLIINPQSSTYYTKRLNKVLNSYLDKNSLKYVSKYNASGIYRGLYICIYVCIYLYLILTSRSISNYQVHGMIIQYQYWNNHILNHINHYIIICIKIENKNLENYFYN